MNQTKMEEYKAYKKNRKEILAKEKKSAKARKTAWIIGLSAVALAIVVSLGVTGYNSWYDYSQAKPDYSRSEIAIADVAGVLDEKKEEETTAASESTTAASETTQAAN